MTQSPAIGTKATALPPSPGVTAALPAIQDGGNTGNSRQPYRDDVTLVQDQAEILWQAKHSIDSEIMRSKQQHDGLDDAERQRIQRQVAALALHSAPTVSGRETVARQMEALRGGLNAQDVAVLTRKTATALEVSPVSLTGGSRETILRRVF